MVEVVVAVIGRGLQVGLVKRWVAPYCETKALFGTYLTSCDRSAPFVTAWLRRIMFDASVQSFPTSYGQRLSGL